MGRISTFTEFPNLQSYLLRSAAHAIAATRKIYKQAHCHKLAEVPGQDGRYIRRDEMRIGCDEAKNSSYCAPNRTHFYMKSNRYYYFNVLITGNNYEGWHTRVERTEF